MILDSLLENRRIFDCKQFAIWKLFYTYKDNFSKLINDVISQYENDDSLRIPEEYMSNHYHFPILSHLYVCHSVNAICDMIKAFISNNASHRASTMFHIRE